MEKTLVIADSAEPKSIDEISSYGINILPAVKGEGSISHGIQYVQEQRISVTRRSRNILKEYENYAWLVDKDGDTMNKPAPLWDHAMDAIRYAISSDERKVEWKPNDPGGIRPYYPELGI